VQTIQVLLEKQQRTLVQAHAFPDTVADDESAIEDGHLGLRARHQSAVEIDQRVGIAGIRCKILTSSHASLARVEAALCHGEEASSFRRSLGGKGARL